MTAVPMCAVCHKPVDRLIQEKAFPSGDVVFTAVCHGQSEQAVYPNSEMLIGERVPRVEFGAAFSRERISA